MNVDSPAADANAADSRGAASADKSAPPVVPVQTGDAPPSGVENFREAEELRLAVAASLSEIAIAEEPIAGSPAQTLTDGDVGMATTSAGAGATNIGAAAVAIGENVPPTMDPVTADVPCAAAGPPPTQADTTLTTAGAIAAGTQQDADTGAGAFSAEDAVLLGAVAELDAERAAAAAAIRPLCDAAPQDASAAMIAMAAATTTPAAGIVEDAAGHGRLTAIPSAATTAPGQSIGPRPATFDQCFAMRGPVPTDRALAMEAPSAAYLLFWNLRREAGMFSTDLMPPLPSEAPHHFIGSPWAPTTMRDTPAVGCAAAFTVDGGPTPAADVSMGNV